MPDIRQISVDDPGARATHPDSRSRHILTPICEARFFRFDKWGATQLREIASIFCRRPPAALALEILHVGAHGVFAFGRVIGSDNDGHR
jgi:hypothetical protein